MHYLSPTVYAYCLWCAHVVNRGQQNLGGLLYVGSNCSYSSDNNNNNNNDDDDDDDDDVDDDDDDDDDNFSIKLSCLIGFKPIEIAFL